MLATINWLEASPLPADSPQRKEANQFLMEWISGSPTVSVQMQPYLTDLYGKNPDLLMAFLGGWTRYAIQHPTDKDQLTLQVEGVKGMLASYKPWIAKAIKSLPSWLASTPRANWPTGLKPG